ncbi:MAG: BatA domain-containing protein [Tepidisphaeraceae bacterium]
MTQFSPILSVGFVTPAFFAAGLLLASIPIIIHILNRRRYKTVQWAAMEFLLRAMRKNRRRLKFEQWILLATRCLLLLIVATALARPMGCQDSTLAALAGQRAGLHVIVIDNSYSMAYEAGRPDAATHFDRARKLAKELIGTFLAGGESVAIIVASSPASAVLAAPTYDLQAAQDAVDRVQQTYSGTDLLGALRLAADVGEREKAVTRKNLYLITDGTRSAWETSEADAMKQVGQALARTYRVTHFNLGRQTQWNQAMLEVKPSANLVTNRLSNDLLARAAGFGSSPTGEARVQWKLDDALLPGGGGQVKLGGEPLTLTQTSAVFRTGGPHVVAVSLIGEDRLKDDNNRLRVVDVASELKVLIVEGERGMGRLGGSGAFLELALAPPKEGPTETTGTKSDSYVAPELISDLELGNKVLGDYRAVILAGVGQVSAAQADQLALFVKNGGSLIVFMGEPVSAENYNQVLLPRGLMPGALTKRVGAAGDAGFLFDFNPEGLLHPLLGLFARRPGTGLNTAQVYTYWQMDIKGESKAERVLDYLSSGGVATSAPTTAGVAAGAEATSAKLQAAANDPAITLHSLGEGRVVVVTTTANAEWTSFPAKPSYVALVHELLAGSVSSADRWMNLSASQALLVPAGIKFTAAAKLLDPKQNEIVLQPLAARDGGSYRSPPLLLPGVYHLSTGSATLPIVVNVASEESDVRTLEDAAIKKALGDPEISMESDTLPLAALADSKAGNDFGWPLMLIGLTLVAAECFMAMRFGHYRRSGLSH